MFHSLLCVFCRFGQIYNGLCLALRCWTEPFYYPNHPLDSAFYPSLPSTLGTTALFTVSIVLPFSECQLVGIIFSDWFLTLSNVHLRCLRGFSWLDSSLFFFSTEYSTVWNYHCLFTHSKGIYVASKFWQLCKHLCAGFCAEISF